jgi:chromosome segregation ATPase
MADRELRIKVTAGTKPLKDLQAELRKSKEDLARLELQGKANTKEYKDQAQYVHALNTQYKQLQQSSIDAAQGIDAGSKSITDLSTKLGVAGVAVYALVGSFKKLYDIASAGAGFQTLYDGFVRLSGGVDMAEKNINALRQASAGNLDDESLIQYANEMRSLGFSIDTTTKLIDIAERRGDELGVTFDTAQSALQKFIVTGAGRGLVELGINVEEVKKAMYEYTGATEDQFNQLDELTQQEVRAKIVTDKYGQSLDEIAKKTKGNDDKLASLQSTYSNLWKLLEVGVSSAFVGLSSDIDTNTGSLDKNMKKAIESGESFAKWVKLIWEAGTAFGTLRDYITNLSPVIQALVSPIGAVSSQLTELAYRIGVLKRTQADFETGTKTVGERSQDAVNKIQGDIKAAKDAAKLKKKIDDEIANAGKTGSTGSIGKTTQQQTKELKTFSDQIKDSIAQQEALRDLVTEGTFEWQKYTDEIKKLNDELTKLNSLYAPLIDAEKLLGKVEFNRTPIPEEQGKEGKDKEPKWLDQALAKWEQVSAYGDNLLSSVANTMNALGVGADTFVGKLIGGFNAVLAIMETIKAVNSILSVIPFLATGGIMQSSGLAVVGERGPELVSLPAGARVYNNQDSQRYFNNMNSKQQSVNVYVNANMDGLKFLESNMPGYLNKKNYKRIN